MKPPDPYLPQDLLSACFGIAILFSIIRRIRSTGTTASYSDNTPPNTQRDGICARVGRVYYGVRTHVRRSCYLVSVLIITRLACIITIMRMAMIEAGTDITKKTCSVFYNGVIDPVGTWSANQNSSDGYLDLTRKCYHMKGAGIPGRHNSKRATKRGRARKAPK